MFERSWTSSSLLFILVTITSLVSAQPPGPPQSRAGRPDAMEFLRQALEEAGATALSSDQEKQMQALVDSIRASVAAKQPDEAFLEALSAYQDAVLSGNLTRVKSAAAALAAKEAENSRARLEEQAEWIIKMLAVLTPDQLNKLIARIETNGTFQVFQRLTGRPMGGRGFPGGPGGRPPMMGGVPPE